MIERERESKSKSKRERERERDRETERQRDRECDDTVITSEFVRESTPVSVLQIVCVCVSVFVCLCVCIRCVADFSRVSVLQCVTVECDVV